MTAQPAAEAVLTEDYSDLRLAVARQWTFGDMSLRWIGGAVLIALWHALVAAVVVFVVLLVIYVILGVQTGWILLSFVPTYLACYLFFARERRNRLSVLESMRLWLLSRRESADLAGDGPRGEPTDLCWVLILWSPAQGQR